MRRIQKNNLLLHDINKAKSILRDINWDFYKKHTLPHREINPFNTRKYHWYPATFVPEIPFTLIEVLTNLGAVIYDPFGGIGTTYFQALLLNRYPLTTENCQVAVEYMKALFTLLNPDIKFDFLIDKLNNKLKSFNPKKNYSSDVTRNFSMELLRPWYSPKTLNQLSFLFIKESTSNNDEIKSIMRLSISSILKTVSSQDRGWGCIADNVLPKKSQIKDKDVISLFKKNYNVLIKDISDHLQYMKPYYNNLYKELAMKRTIYHEDVRKNSEIKEESVDLIITSPPYPNMTDYSTSQRLSYYYLGISFMGKTRPKDLDTEIGARIRRNRKDSIDRYYIEMNESNKVISSKIKTGGFACYIMPFFNKDNENDSIRRDVVEKVLSNMKEYNLDLEDEYERILPSIRRSQNFKWATLEREKIYLFRKY